MYEEIKEKKCKFDDNYKSIDSMNSKHKKQKKLCKSTVYSNCLKSVIKRKY